MTSSLEKAARERFEDSVRIVGGRVAVFGHDELEALLAIVRQEARAGDVSDLLGRLLKEREVERDEARARAEAAEGLLASLIHAVEQARLADDNASVEPQDSREELLLERETAHEALDEILSASRAPSVEAWGERLAQIVEQESNIAHICERAMRTRDLLESTRIELELVVKRLTDRLRSRATSEQVTADRYRDLASRNELPHPNEEYRLRDRHEHTASVLTEEADFVETLTGFTIERAKKFVEEARTK